MTYRSVRLPLLRRRPAPGGQAAAGIPEGLPSEAVLAW